MNSILRVLLMVALLQTVQAPGQAHAQTSLPAAVEIQQPPRAFGYFIGDVLLQRAQATEAIVASADLQTEQRVTDYLYRLPSRFTSDNGVHSVELRYQIINVPRKASTIALPETRLQTTSGSDVVLESWSFKVSSLFAARGGEDPPEDPLAADILPDRSSLAIIDRADDAKLNVSLVALLASIGLWLAWWALRHFKDARTLPFANARRNIARLPKNQRDTEPSAWIARHHAFNGIAGKTISAGSIDELFIAAPWLTPSRDAIEQFYRASDERFFKQADHLPSLELAALCETLYRLEIRHATPALRQAAPRSAAT